MVLGAPPTSGGRGHAGEAPVPDDADDDAVDRRLACSAPVIFVADVVAPRDGAAPVVDLLHRQVDHEPIRSRSVPVVLAGPPGPAGSMQIIRPLRTPSAEAGPPAGRPTPAHDHEQERG
jgi:hypothetical protein